MNIAKLLKERELHPTQVRTVIENSLEDSFIAGNAKQFDNPLPRSVSSTIAIAMSCNGQTFATTHGDHTVKVFDFMTGGQIRVFSGHPRTPWTIKYHPTEPNIVASGCLGFEVRVWDIEANVCLTMTTFTQTIISLAFHPKGHFIAVACGMHIELWDWNNRDESGITPTARAAKPYNAEEDGSAENYFDGEVEEYPPHWRSITHTRNIRAVLFHPSGDYIFAVAPEAPKQSNDELAHCRLYACEFAALLNVDGVSQWGEVSGPVEGNELPYYQEDPLTEEIDLAEGEEVILPLKLCSCRVLIPQIHLYSDGGIDISKDGNYLFTCARVHYPPALQEFGYGQWRKSRPVNISGAFSPNSHPARLVADERESKLRASGFTMPSRGPLMASESELPRHSSKPIHQRFATTGTAPTTQANSDSAPPPPPLFLPRNLRHENDALQPAFAGLSTPPPTAPRMPTSARSSNSNGGSDVGSNLITSGGSGGGSGSAFSAFGSTQQSPGQLGATPTKSPVTGVVAGTSVLNDTEGATTLQDHLQQLSLKDPLTPASSTVDGVPIVVNMTSNGAVKSSQETSPLCEQKAAMSPMVDSRKICSDFAPEFCAPDDRTVSGISAIMSERKISVPYPRQRQMQLCEKTPPGWLYEDHMCLFDLSFSPTGAILKPTLINSKLLPGALMKAVTSTKLSATCRYALIGYGVRVGGVVQDHCRRHAACEVISIQDEAMRSMTVMSDFEDEVNIAQFHPFAGHGIVYGTKRGKIRTFSKT